MHCIYSICLAFLFLLFSYLLTQFDAAVLFTLFYFTSVSSVLSFASWLRDHSDHHWSVRRLRHLWCEPLICGGTYFKEQTDWVWVRVREESKMLFQWLHIDLNLLYLMYCVTKKPHVLCVMRSWWYEKIEEKWNFNGTSDTLRGLKSPHCVIFSLGKIRDFLLPLLKRKNNNIYTYDCKCQINSDN